jgi:uncharacterized phage protein (TIGR01671 family)
MISRGDKMREIKFRVFVESMNRYIKWSDAENNCFVDMLDYGIDAEENVCVEQFTGLHDKNGKEIYEGDKLQNGIDGHTWIIEWAGDGDYCGFVAVNKRGHRELFLNRNFKNAEVIENIHENMEIGK